MIGGRGRKDAAVPVVDDPAELATALGREREVAAARRRHELERERAEAGHGRDRADLAEAARLAELERAERAEDAAASVGLARLYRQARAAGERTRITSEMARSGEARALRLERLRRRNLLVLVPLLIGFGVWSTTGVQQGAARLMAVDMHSPVWWVLWGLEGLLIGLVCWVIICRAVLGAAGGRLDASEGPGRANRPGFGDAEKVAAGALTVSVFLNLVAAVPAELSASAGWWAVPGAMFAHLIGPVGAAVTAHLIGVVDKAITGADPWTGQDGRPVPLLAEMDLAVPALMTAAPALDTPAENTPQDAPGNTPVTVPAPPVWPVPCEGRRVLPVVARPAENGRPAAPRTGGDRREDRAAGTARRSRPNRGKRVPEAAKPAPVRPTDDELTARLAGLLEAGDAERTVRSAMRALGVGYERARRVLDGLPENAAENTGEGAGAWALAPGRSGPVLLTSPDVPAALAVADADGQAARAAGTAVAS
ncbi:hypothetical protein AGRA3207_007865 (plasmid) [Actinomadura graeca]|uniref:DUF2637 domain-containing protein n=1 Tax=Actinomadura graeca TaxID=2750812 RepID=A0ABX8RAT2_9ACTN|nr:hypothetical protein [Actinomadura graeca]QXJ27067.1 hypothetical protein AGRA3207_007865 [Actinomadura graeca]